MGGAGGVRLDAESPRELVAEMEGHLRALLRDILCGYLDADLKAVADDILIESGPDPQVEIQARDLRKEPEQEPEQEPEPVHEHRFEREPVPMTFEPELEWEAESDTAEMEAVAVAHQPVQHELDGVTQSADWGWDDPEDFSAPV
jgi:hypothetical protein